MARSASAKVSQFQPPKVHIRRNELNAVLPSFWLTIPFPDNHGGIAGMRGEIGESETLLEVERIGHDHHTAVGIDNAGVRFHRMSVARSAIPLQAYVDAGIHAAAPSLFAVLYPYLLQFAQVNRHRCL